jgi:PDZ domain
VQLAQTADDGSTDATPGDKSGGAKAGEAKDKSNDGSAASSGPGGNGVEVAGVVPESAAWFAGLEQGDRILAIDGKELAAAQDLVGAVSGKEPGTLIDVKFMHAGEERTARVRLGERHPTSDLGALMPGLHFMPFGQGQGGLGGGANGGQGGGGLGLNVPRPRGRGPFGGGAFGGFGGGAPGQGPQGGMQGFSFDDDSFGDMLPGNIQQFLKGLDLDAQGSQRQSVRVEMRNGKGTLTVTRDGKTETYTMDDQGQWKKSADPDPGTPDAGKQGAAPSGTQ